MSWLDVTDLAELEAALEAVELCHWIEVETAGEAFRLVHEPGGWHLPGDLVIASGDVADGRLSRVEALGDLWGDDPYDERDGVAGWAT